MLTISEKRGIDDQIAALREMPPALPREESSRLTIKDFKPGTYFLLEGKLYKVTAKHRYQEGKQWVWWEFSILCVSTGEQSFIEWEEDDYLEVCLTTRAGISIRELGISQSNISAFLDSEEDIHFEGKSFEYEDDLKAKFFRDDGTDFESVKMWEFECGDDYLTVELWYQEDGETWEAALSRAVNPSDIIITSC